MADLMFNQFSVEILTGYDKTELIKCLETESIEKDLPKVFISTEICDYLSALQDVAIVQNDFVKDIQVWIACDKDSSDTLTFDSFRLRVLVKSSEDKYEASIGVSYDGVKTVLKKTFIDLTDDQQSKVTSGIDLIKKVKVKKEPDHIANFNPIVNLPLRKALGLPMIQPSRVNMFKKHVTEIKRFYSSYLLPINEQGKIRFSKSGPSRVLSYQTSKIEQTTNTLIFGNKETNYNVYNGLKLHGPYAGPKNNVKPRFIFIFKDSFKNHANALYSYLKKGHKSFPGLKSFIGLEFDIAVEDSITFTNQDSITEVCDKINDIEYELNDEFQLVAIYISEYDKDEQDDAKKEYYYKIKEALLKKGISSQVIVGNKIKQDSFNYFLPNIAVALLAKSGGKPWLIDTSRSSSIVIGVGAYKSIHSNETYFGNTVAFDSGGDFIEFDSYRESNIGSLIYLIRRSIEQIFSATNKPFKTLILHLYKDLNKSEQDQLDSLFDELTLDIPYVVLNVNEERSILAFDNDFDEFLPVSGTIVRVRFNQYLLYNNTRYSERTRTRIDGYPFPIRVKFGKSKRIDLQKEEVRNYLLSQVYQFSRIYWKSVRQRSLPVTIEYSKVIASMVAHFEDGQMPKNRVANNTLWFL